MLHIMSHLLSGYPTGLTLFASAEAFTRRFALHSARLGSGLLLLVPLHNDAGPESSVQMEQGAQKESPSTPGMQIRNYGLELAGASQNRTPPPPQNGQLFWLPFKPTPTCYPQKQDRSPLRPFGKASSIMPNQGQLSFFTFRAMRLGSHRSEVSSSWSIGGRLESFFGACKTVWRWLCGSTPLEY